MIKISVIIPLYNAARFIEPCLESVCAQSLANIEILCINDGSSDNTAEIIRTWRAREPRIRLLEQKNSGSGAARNLGLRQARGEFVAFMDGDDWYPSANVLESLYSAATENHLGIAGGSFVRHFSDGRVVDTFDGIYSAYTFNRAEKVSFRDYQFDYGYHRFIYSREMLLENQIDFPSYKRFQDPPFFVRAMIASGSFYSLPMQVYAYRKGHQTISWDVEKIEGVLLGLTDDLLISRREDLGRLHRLSYTRFATEFLKLSLPHIKGSHRLYFDLQRLLAAVDPELLRRDAEEGFFTEILTPDFARKAFEGTARPPAPSVPEKPVSQAPAPKAAGSSSEAAAHFSTHVQALLGLIRARKKP